MPGSCGPPSPASIPRLTALGVDPGDLVASSRTTGFEAIFGAATGGAGIDVVLDALAGGPSDASLRLLPRGGQFIEMGKTDIRDPAQVAADHGVAYRAFDLSEAGPDRLGQILAEVTVLLAAGKLTRLPVTGLDVRRAREAFRYMSQGRHTGKIVLTIPPGPAAHAAPRARSWSPAGPGPWAACRSPGTSPRRRAAPGTWSWRPGPGPPLPASRPWPPPRRRRHPRDRDRV